MDAPPADFRALGFSTSEVPARDRLDVWRHLLSRKLLKAKVDPIDAEPYLAHVEMRALPTGRVGIGTVDASIIRHDREMVAADNDDFMLAANVDGTFVVSQRRAELALEPGEAALINCAEVGTYMRPSRGTVLCVRMPRSVLESAVPHLDDAIVRRIPRSLGALRLLTNYARHLCDRHVVMDTPDMRRAVSHHLADLMAVAIGASRDAAAVARGRGVRAARLRAIQEDVVDHLGRADLSIGHVATRHNVTTRQVQRLFEGEGITFSEYLLEQRLNRAHQILTDERFLLGTISAVAYQCGFGEISYFNRAFRRRFGMTPSDAREQAGSGKGG